MDKRLVLAGLVVGLTLCLGQALFVRAESETDKTAEPQAGPVTLDTDPNLVGWWKFDETSGESAADSSRHRRNGALRGGLSFDKASADGRVGKALKLDERGYVEISKYKGITGTRPRTITAWIKTKERDGEIVSWGVEDFGQMWICRFIRGRIGVTPSGGYFYMKEAVSDDKWHHVAAVVLDAELPNLHDDIRLYRPAAQEPPSN